MHRLVLHQLFLAGEEDGVVQSRAAAGTQIANGFGERSRVVRQVGYKLRAGIEADHHGLVLRTHHAVDEFNRRFLLEPEAIANAVAAVDQNGEAQGQVGFRGELDDLLRLLVLEDVEVVFARGR